MPLIPIDPCYFSSGVAEKKQKKKEVWPIPRLGEKTLTHIKEKKKKSWKETMSTASSYCRVIITIFLR
jgi:hypothetical protein